MRRVSTVDAGGGESRFDAALVFGHTTVIAAGAPEAIIRLQIPEFIPVAPPISPGSIMPLLAFLGPLKCVYRVVIAFFMLAFLVFPAAAETAPPPISGSNGLMGLWGGNSSASQTGGSNDQDGATAPGAPTESRPPSADAQYAEPGSSPRSAPRNVVPPPISDSNGLMGEWGANSSEPQGGSSGKPISGSNDLQGTTAPGIPIGSSLPSADAYDAELKSIPPDELEPSPPSPPGNVAPLPSVQVSSDGLIEWSLKSQTGSSGKPISGPKDQQGTSAPGPLTESSPPSAESQDAELTSIPPDELEPSPPSTPGNVAPSPSPSVRSGAEGSMGEGGASGSAAQTDSRANTSGKAVTIPNGQHANVGNDIVAPETQTELSPLSAPPQQSLEATAPPASKVLVVIDKPTQKMKVYVDDVELYSWKVSSGLPGHATPSGAYTASSMNEIWYSKEWDDAPMPHAIFFTKEGHAIHATEETKKLGRPASHGCVRLAPENARTLFALVKEKGLQKTEIVLNGDTPGGESRVAKTSPRKQQMKRAKTRDYRAPPPRFGRRDWFQRRFSGKPPPQRFYWR